VLKIFAVAILIRPRTYWLNRAAVRMSHPHINQWLNQKNHCCKRLAITMLPSIFIQYLHGYLRLPDDNADCFEYSRAISPQDALDK